MYLAIGITQFAPVEHAAAATENSLGLGTRIDAVAEGAYHVAVAEKFHFHFHAQPAAPLTRAGRVGLEFKAPQVERILHLEHFGVLRQKAATAGDQTDVVVAVGAGGAATTTLQTVEQDVHERLACPAIEADGGDGEQRVPGGGDPLRQCRSQRIENRRRDLVGQMVAERAGGGEARVDDRSFGQIESQRSHDAGVLRNARILQAHQQRQGNRRDRRGGRCVHVARRLWRGAGEVEIDTVALDRDLDANVHGRARREAVVMGCRQAMIDAVRNVADLGAHLLFGGVVEVLQVGVEAVPAVTRDQLDQFPIADRAAAHGGLDVLLDDGEADVAENQIPDILALLALLMELHRRDAQRFLPDFRGAGVVGAGHRAADIGLVAVDGREADQPLAEKDRPDDLDIGRLVAAGERVVVDDHIARIQAALEVGDDVLDALRNGECEDRDVRRLFHHVAVRVVKAGDEIARLGQDGRPGGAQHDQPHFLGDRLQPPLDDGDQYRIDPALAGLCHWRTLLR